MECQNFIAQICRNWIIQHRFDPDHIRIRRIWFGLGRLTLHNNAGIMTKIMSQGDLTPLTQGGIWQSTTKASVYPG